ncbi:MAG: DUF4062 domain-containing protein [Acidobacteriota bacterium]
MATPWRTLRIFISSTFRDMHSERDYLVRVVFPELRERCAKRRLHLVDVDLRWGVTEEEAERGRVLEICLDEIERCRPFFLGILGERYGSVIPRVSAPDEPSYDWLRELAEEHSVTALEIYHGVLRNQGLRTRAFFYFRDPAFLSSIPAELRDAFLPENEGAAQRLAALKAEIRSQCQVFDNYPCTYAGASYSRVTLAGLDTFGQRVLDDLWSAISDEYPEEAAPPDELEIERGFHEAFVESRVGRFIGRADLLEGMKDYAGSDRLAPLVVAGAPGSGKSALLAKFAHDYARDHADTFVLSHFIGASPGSTDIRLTLLRLCAEIDRHYGIEARIPEDFQELWQEFLKRLERAGAIGRVLLVIDALNQLDDRHDPHALHWLPASLPPGVRVIVSTLEGESLRALRRRRPVPEEIVVGALSDDERRALVRQTLWDYRKRLDERTGNDQMGRLLSKAEADNPLYLVVACEELRLFGEFERVTARIDGLPENTERLLEQVLERLEVDLGADLVRDTLSLLECSRHGLLEIEMLELLGRDSEEQLPRAVWARLYRGLRFYLRPTGEAGEGMLDFFHRQLAKAVRKRYLAGDAESVAHARLARFFRSKVDPLNARRWKRECPRGLSELPHHLLHARLYDDLFVLARDKSFLGAVAGVFSEDPQLSLEPLQKALEGGAQLDDAALMAEFMLAHTRRRADVAGESPLQTLQHGQVERAWELADMHPPERCVVWHLLLAWRLKDSGSLDQARATLARLAQRELPRLPHSSWAARCALYLLSKTVEVSEPLFRSMTERLLEDDELVGLCAAVASLGHTASARALADSISVEYRRDDAHCHIAREQVEIVARQAQASDFSGARATAEEIADNWYRAVAIRKIASAQAEAGLREASRASFAAAAELVPATWELREGRWRGRADVLRDIALAQARAGFIEEARASFMGAADSARTHRDSYEAEEYLAGIAAALAEAGQTGMALELARELPSANRKAKAQFAVVAEDLRSGNLPSALTTARAIAHPEDQMNALNLIAIAQADGNQREAARATFEEARRAAMRVRDIQDGANGLRQVALAEAKAALIEDARATFDKALKTVRGAATDRLDDNQLMNLAIAQAQAGEFDAAISTANLMSDDFFGEQDQIRALAEVASEGAKSGHLDAARNLLSDLVDRVTSNSSSFVDAWGAIGQAYVKLEDFTAACGVIELARDRGWPAADAIVYAVFGYPASFKTPKKRSIKDSDRARAIIGDMLQAMLRGDTTHDENRSKALCELVKAQIDSGDLDGALNTARRIQEGDHRASAYQAASAVLARGGELDRAFELANEIPQQEARDQARGTIAEELARSHQFDQALTIARELGDWQRRAALRGIAVAMAHLGEFDRAIQTANENDNKRDMRIHITSAEVQVASGDLLAARESFARAVQAAHPEPWSDALHEASVQDKPWSDALHEAYFATLQLREVADQQAKAGFGEDARATLLLAREAGLRAVGIAAGRTDRERDSAAESLKWIGERQAKLGLVGDALETVELMQTRQRVWHREVQRTKEGMVLMAVSAAQADARNFAAAYESAGRIEPQDVHIDALKHLALAEARAGVRDAANRHLLEAIAVALEFEQG